MVLTTASTFASVGQYIFRPPQDTWRRTGAQMQRRRGAWPYDSEPESQRASKKARKRESEKARLRASEPARLRDCETARLRDCETASQRDCENASQRDCEPARLRDCEPLRASETAGQRDCEKLNRDPEVLEPGPCCSWEIHLPCGKLISFRRCSSSMPNYLQLVYTKKAKDVHDCTFGRGVEMQRHKCRKDASGKPLSPSPVSSFSSCCRNMC